MRVNCSPCEKLAIFLLLRFLREIIFCESGVSKYAYLTVSAPLNLVFSKYLQHYWKTQSGSTFFASSAVSLKKFKKIKIPNLTSKFVFKIKMDPPLAINFTRSKFARGLRAAFRANKAHFSNWRNDNLWADYLRVIIQWEYNVEGKYYFKISWNL